MQFICVKMLFTACALFHFFLPTASDVLKIILKIVLILTVLGIPCAIIIICCVDKKRCRSCFNKRPKKPHTGIDISKGSVTNVAYPAKYDTFCSVEWLASCTVLLHSYIHLQYLKCK